MTPEEQLHRQKVSMHQEWLKHPLTADLVRILVERRLKYEEALFSHILKQSDKEFEDKHRSAINTCEAILKILTDSETFLKQLEPINKQ